MVGDTTGPSPAFIKYRPAPRSISTAAPTSEDHNGKVDPLQSATRTSGSTREHLTERQFDQFRSSLQQQQMFRTEQLAELAATAAIVTFMSSNAHDEIINALRAGAEAALGDINSALTRIVAGTFGTCTVCGDAIPTERLEILPMAALCMQCARARSAAR